MRGRSTSLSSRSEFNRCSLPRLTVKLGDKELGDMAKMIREEQRKEDDLEKMIREWKKQTKKRPAGENSEQPRNKRTRLENTRRSYEGSREHLFATNSPISDSVSRYDERVEIAIDEALRICDTQEEDRVVHDWGDVRMGENCAADNCANVAKIELAIVET